MHLLNLSILQVVRGGMGNFVTNTSKCFKPAWVAFKRDMRREQEEASYSSTMRRWLWVKGTFAISSQNITFFGELAECINDYKER